MPAALLRPSIFRSLALSRSCRSVSSSAPGHAQQAATRSPSFSSQFRYVTPVVKKPSPRKDVYQLPVNNEEVARLNNQHVLLKMLIGGNYIAPVKEYLSRQDGRNKAILDLGCGTGAWAMDMAREFPHCSVVGADIAPMDVNLAPENLRIDVCDANEGLHMYRNQFDVVNGRMIAMGIKDYNSLIGDASMALRSGGFLQLQEWDFFVVDGKKQVIDTDRWFGRWCAALRHSLVIRNASVNAAEGLDSMIKSNGTFSDIHQRNIWMPVGPSFSKDTAEGQHLNFVGEFMRENVKAFIKGGKALILGSGMSSEEYREIEFNASLEVQDEDIPMFLRLNCVTARKL